MGCAAAPLPETRPAGGPPPAGLRVSLVFGAEGDLDLYVTDPFFETVYFANTPSRASGGALDADRRCDSPAPRVETVRFERPRPGRYRVSVDYPERCGSVRAPLPFRVVVEHGSQREERAGEISLGEFLPVVVEFDWRRPGAG